MSASDSTVAACAAEAVASLVAAGRCPASARLDVAVLARHILHWDAARWLTDQRLPAPALFRSRLGTLTARRAINEPVAYIVGEREFYGRSFLVSRQRTDPAPRNRRPDRRRAGGPANAVFVPDRACSISVPAAAAWPSPSRSRCLEHASTRQTSQRPRSTSPARTRRVMASADAVTFHNVSRNALAGGPFDVILSNPPYVPESDRASLSPDVRDYEPSLALFGGRDGLDVIRTVIPDAARSLRPGGWLFMEIGQGQAGSVEALVRECRSGLDRRRVPISRAFRGSSWPGLPTLQTARLRIIRA